MKMKGKKGLREGKWGKPITFIMITKVIIIFITIIKVTIYRNTLNANILNPTSLDSVRHLFDRRCLRPECLI
ncbi:MAG: DUF4492 domain-containing protein [Lewinellaceae bacterium]|nr:DUF4492 domain-containing protein [Phaeodactylibacter sp.]MCB9041949.1 DUF4492 domain-containing protein [Lewinellaceae bacterium]